MTGIRKILMVVENNSVPADGRVWAEATTLRDAGFQVSVICPKTSSDSESSTCLEQIWIYRYHLPAATNLAFSYAIEYSLAIIMTFWLSLLVLFHRGFDVVHAANPPDLFFLIGVFYRLLGKKFVFDQHDLAPELFRVKAQGRMGLLYKLQLFFEHCSYRVAQCVIVTNVSQGRAAMERGGCPVHKVFLVWNGPDLQKMTLVEPEPALKKGRPFLLAYAGRMGTQDGIENALYALDELVHKRGRQDVSLILMGTGDYLPELRILAQKLELAEYLHFTGWLKGDEVMRYLRAADIGLTPDPQNGFNEYCTMIKTLEYMAVGLPIVAFDLVETRRAAQGAALYATPNLVEDFADKIETLLNDADLRCTLGSLGRKRIEEELSWDHAKKNLLLAYKTLRKG
jgi:glycosyltransferase involved in cell wall biosynthesis